MRLTTALGLTLATLTMTAPMAFAEGCSKWGHSAMLSAEAQVEDSAPAMTPMPKDNMVAMLDCSDLSGDALAECEAALATTTE